MDIEARGWPVNDDSLKRLVQERDLAAEQQEMQEIEKEVFNFLEAIKETENVNMLGTAHLIVDEFNVQKDVAKILLAKWLKQ